MSRRVAKTRTSHSLSWEAPGRLGFVSSDGLDHALVDGITCLALATTQAGLWLESGLYTMGVHEEVVGLLPRLLAPSVVRDGYELIFEPVTTAKRCLVLVPPGSASGVDVLRAECSGLIGALGAINSWVRASRLPGRTRDKFVPIMVDYFPEG